jgi:putative hydrolase of the HAD superfamily
MEESFDQPAQRGRAREPVRLVFFDVGGTILTVRPSVGHVYAEAAARLGYPVDPQGVNRAFRAAWGRSLARRRAAEYVSTDAILREEWRTIVADSFSGLVPEEIALRAFEELYEHFAGPEPWGLAAGAEETFRALKALGVRLGILSNWDRRLPLTLEKLGISRYFDLMVISYEVGVEKPHPRIFEEALRLAGGIPAGTAMVGDSLDQDIEPARALGWRTLWLGGEKSAAGGRPPVGPPTVIIRELSEVPGRLGPWIRTRRGLSGS